MKAIIQIQLHTSDYRGDHETDVVEAIDCPEGTTVERLAEILAAHSKFDYLTVRIAIPAVKP